MKANVGGWDRMGRFALAMAGFTIATLPTVRKPWRTLAMTLGGMSLMTATTGYCPLNQVLGVDTRRNAPRTRNVNVTGE